MRRTIARETGRQGKRPHLKEMKPHPETLTTIALSFFAGSCALPRLSMIKNNSQSRLVKADQVIRPSTTLLSETTLPYTNEEFVEHSGHGYAGSLSELKRINLRSVTPAESSPRRRISAVTSTLILPPTGSRPGKTITFADMENRLAKAAKNAVDASISRRNRVAPSNGELAEAA